MRGTEIREGQVFMAIETCGSDGRLIDGWRRIVGIDQPAGYVAFVGQRSDRVKFVKRNSFARWIRQKCGAQKTSDQSKAA